MCKWTIIDPGGRLKFCMLRPRVQRVLHGVFESLWGGRSF